MTLYFDVINKSTVVSDADLAKICAAIELQIHRDFAPIWTMGYGAQVAVRGTPVKSSRTARHLTVFVLDDSDVANALGYHDVDEHGNPLGKVFAATDLKYGLELSVTMSHEILEMLGDMFCSDGWFVDSHRWFAREMSDPCEADKLGYEINGVLVSDFVTPEWFQIGSDGPWSFRDSLPGALTLAPGGYCSLWSQATGWIQDNKAAEVGVTSRLVTSTRHTLRQLRALRHALPSFAD